MADQHSNEGLSTGNVSGESSDSFVELKIKTLDSQIFSFHVDKSTPVLLFKEKIANEIGVPVGQQRLIFRGKVLKDEHLLSEYHVENGHTLHLVERQPAQSQPSSDTSSGETNGNNTNQGNDASAGIPRNRVGQISHSVVLGTFNVGDQGEGIVPDLTRVIGAVLNSFGVGGQPTTNGINSTQSSTSASQGNETDGAPSGGQNQAGNQTQSAQSFPGQTFQFSPQVMPISLTPAAMPVPSLNSPIPDALNTLSEFMNHMEAHSPNGYQLHSSTTNRGDQPRVELPSDARGLPTPEALSIVMRHAERLLSSHAIAALSHIAERLEQERNSPDPTVRGQIQTESVQVGLAMQHLGALLLELGRTILTLRMGHSPAESSVNAGPAVYISPSGPNPIMVQPFPLQTSSLFSGSHSPSNPPTLGPVGVGTAPRHINIHIHAGTALAPIISAVGNRTSNGEGVQGERGNNAGSGSMRVLPVRNVLAAAVPARPTGAVSSAAQSAPTDSSISSIVAEVNSRLRNFVSNMQGGNQVASGNGQPGNVAVSGAGDSSVALPADILQTEEQKSQPQHAEGSNNIMESGVSSKDVSTGTVECPPSSSGELLVKSEDPSGSVLRSGEDNAKAVPLGLGLGGLERKKRIKQTKSPVSTGDSGTTSSSLDQNLSVRTTGQQILQSLVSRSSSVNRVEHDASPSNPGVQSSRLSGGQGSDDQLDAANAVSQVLQSPALNGLLAGVSEQTGVGSPDVFRNMLQQLTQSPQIMNTVGQLAQQVDSQDIGNMFSGLGGGQGGGIDLSRMVQQMMPIVSQALSRGASAPPPFPAVEPQLQGQLDGRKSSAADKPCDRDFQDDIQQMAQRIEQSNSPDDVFHTVAENAVRVYGNGRNAEELLNELCGDEGLAKLLLSNAVLLKHLAFMEADAKPKKSGPRLCCICNQRRAVLKRPKTLEQICRECFYEVFEEEIHQVIVENQLFKPGDRIAIGASGGKDSTVLAYVLSELNRRHNYGLDLFLLSVDEGITGYRDDSLETVKRNELQYGLPLKIVSYKDLYGWTMDEIVKMIGLKNNCTFCGVFRRQALDRGAALLKVDKVATGHNADDIAETVLLNILRGDIASCQNLNKISTYAYFKKLDYFSTECIYSPNAYRGFAREFIKDLERIRPRAILDIITSGENFRISTSTKMPEQGTCERCGYISSQVTIAFTLPDTLDLRLLATGRGQTFPRCRFGVASGSVSLMASPDSATTGRNAGKSLGFISNAMKHRHNFIQFFAMTGILLLSVRSLGQKYRIHDLQEDTAALKQEQESLTDRMKNIKRGLLHEASLEPTGLFASRLRLLFGDDN
ncbi:hypothetical protein QUC31_000420 [Theobroma cacao]